MCKGMYQLFLFGMEWVMARGGGISDKLDCNGSTYFSQLVHNRWEEA